jgi:hypothetical protein
MGFFVVDRDGVVRYSLAGSYMVPPSDAAASIAVRPIPDLEEILKALEACARN